MSLENKQGGLLRVRLETISMGQLSDFGFEASLARMRNSNPVLFRYLEECHPLVPELIAPVYNLIFLEYELQGKKVPKITEETVKEYQSLEQKSELDLEDIRNSQPDLTKTIGYYIDGIKGMNSSIAKEVEALMVQTFHLLQKQADKEETKT